MAVVVRVDVDQLRLPTHGPVAGPIRFDFGGRSFPGAGWSDYPVEILGWWLAQVRGNFRGVKLMFSDITFHVRVLREGALKGLVEAVEGSAEGERVVLRAAVDYAEFRESVVSAARTVLAACRKNGWESGDVELLSRALD